MLLYIYNMVTLDCVNTCEEVEMPCENRSGIATQGHGV